MQQPQGGTGKGSEYSWDSLKTQHVTEVQLSQGTEKLTWTEVTVATPSKHSEHLTDLTNLLPEGVAMEVKCLQQQGDSFMQNCEWVEHSQDLGDQQWCDINEVIECDFLISSGDTYPNRKVQLEDADIKDTTKAAFELVYCVIVCCSTRNGYGLRCGKDCNGMVLQIGQGSAYVNICLGDELTSPAFHSYFLSGFRS